MLCGAEGTACHLDICSYSELIFCPIFCILYFSQRWNFSFSGFAEFPGSDIVPDKLLGYLGSLETASL